MMEVKDFSIIFTSLKELEKDLPTKSLFEDGIQSQDVHQSILELQQYIMEPDIEYGASYTRT